MRTAKLVAPFALALLLVGAGCDTATTNTNATNESLGMSIPEKTETTADQPKDEAKDEAKDDAKDEAKDDAKVEEGWETYTNAALGFSFNWPKKGRYAPTWSVTFPKAGDAKVKDDCFVADGVVSKLNAGDRSFCHTAVSAKDGLSATDYYVTKVGTRTVVITFTKKADAGKDFSWTEYRTQLDKAVATFKTK